MLKMMLSASQDTYDQEEPGAAAARPSPSVGLMVQMAGLGDAKSENAVSHNLIPPQPPGILLSVAAADSSVCCVPVLSPSSCRLVARQCQF